MAIRTRAEIKAFFETEDEPTQQEFADTFDSVPFLTADADGENLLMTQAEREKISASSEVSLSLTDGNANHAKLQALLDAGAPIALPKQHSPCTFELATPHNAAMWGHGSDYGLVFPGLTNGIVPADAVEGNVSCLFDNFVLDGGWTEDWATDPGSVNTVGMKLLSDISGVVTNIGNSSANLGDNYSRVTNMHVLRWGGDGVVAEGRGEVLFAGNNIQTILKRGFDLTAYDMWIWANSISVIGQEALWIGRAGATTGQQSGAAGNIRGFGNKYWFVGQSTHTAPRAAVVFDSPGHTHSIWACETIQDTQGTAIEFNGDGIHWSGAIDAVRRLYTVGNRGLESTVDDYAVVVNDLRQGQLNISLDDREHEQGAEPDLQTRLLNMNIGSTLNNITLNPVQNTGRTPWWDEAHVVDTHADIDGTNLVRDPRGNILSAGLECPGLTKIVLTASDETTEIEVGVRKVSLPVLEDFKILGVEAYAPGAPTGSSLIADVMLDGTSIMASDKLEIEDGETSTLTAATPPAITTSEALKGEFLQVDITQVGSTFAGAGLKVAVIGYPT